MIFIVIKDNKMINSSIDADKYEDIVYPYDYDEIITEDEYKIRFVDDWYR